MGAYAHVVEDRVVDGTMKGHAAEVGEKGRDDMENGMLEIAGQGWLRRDFRPYVPRSDLDRIFAEADYYRDPRLNRSNFEEAMTLAMARGEILNSELKLLSFLSVGYERRAYPWGQVNLPKAPGGFSSNAAAVAAGWEAIWEEVHGEAAPFFVFSIPADGGVIASTKARSPYGQILIVTRRRFDMRNLPLRDVRLTDGAGAAAPVTVAPYIDEPNLYPYIPTVGHDLDLAFRIKPLRDFIPGERYTLAIAPGSYAPTAGPIAPFKLTFIAPKRPLYEERRSAPRPWSMGLFLFVFVGAVAGMTYGAPDVVRLALPPQRTGAIRHSAWLNALEVLFKILSLLLAASAVWLLLSDGSIFIEFLRRHH
jgi:hypothetical protein